MWILYLGMLIPLIATIILVVKFREKTHIVEIVIMWVASFSVIMGVKFISEKFSTMETEYWGEYGIRVDYYERWDEYIHQTCSSTDSDGNTTYYDCSYVDTHYPYWEVITNTGNTYTITESQFNKYSKLWKSKKFQDIGRDYHSIDGDKYESYWDKKEENIFPVITTHMYENRVSNSSSIYDFMDVDTSQFKVFSYPEVEDYQCNSILSEVRGKEISKGNKKLTIYNARYGTQKQVRMWLLIFKDKPFQYSTYQENYWKGGNKNEVVLCVGVRDSLLIDWVKCFSWTNKEILKVNLRDSVLSQKYLDIDRAIEVMKNEVIENFKRREFKEFDYLEVEPSLTATLLSLLFISLVVGGMVVYIISNDFNNEEVRSNKGKFDRYMEDKWKRR